MRPLAVKKCSVWMAHLFDVWIWIRVLLRGNVNCYSVSWLRWRGFGSFSEKIRKHKLAKDHLSFVHNWCQSTALECDSRRVFMWTDTFFPRAQCPCLGTWSRRCTRVLNGTWILGVPVCERNTILRGCPGTALGHQGVNTVSVLIRCKMNSLIVANNSFDPNQTI